MRKLLIFVLLAISTGCGETHDDPSISGPAISLTPDSSMTFALSHEDGRPAGSFSLDCYGIEDGDIIIAGYRIEETEPRTEWTEHCLPGSGAPASDCIVLRRDFDLLLVRRDDKLITIYLGTGTGTLALIDPELPVPSVIKVYFLEYLTTKYLPDI